MVATLANEECRRLYTVKDIKLYAALKDSIYARYRMLAEMLGIPQLCTEHVVQSEMFCVAPNRHRTFLLYKR